MKRRLAILLVFALLFAFCLTACLDAVPVETPVSTTPEATTPTHEHSFVWLGSKDGHRKSFTCGCPSDDVIEAHVNVDEDMRCDVCGYNFALRGDQKLLSEEETWLGEITENDVVEVKSTYFGGRVLDGKLRLHVSVTDKDDIKEILEDYKTLVITEISPTTRFELVYDDHFTVEFRLMDGRTMPISINYGFMYMRMAVSSTKRYSVDEIPTLDSYESAVTSYSFNTYDGHAITYTTSGKRICDIYNVRQMEFVKDEWLGKNMPTEYIDTEVGRMIVYNERHFMLDGEWYALTEGNFFDLFHPCNELSSAYPTGSRIECFYGKYPSGAIVGLVYEAGAGYTEALWAEKVGGHTFEYRDGNGITVLYGGQKYTLGDAYDKGVLTDSDIAKIFDIHYQVYGYLYP